jgi:hypothetical protein
LIRFADDSPVNTCGPTFRGGGKLQSADETADDKTIILFQLVWITEPARCGSALDQTAPEASERYGNWRPCPQRGRGDR